MTERYSPCQGQSCTNGGVFGAHRRCAIGRRLERRAYEASVDYYAATTDEDRLAALQRSWDASQAVNNHVYHVKLPTPQATMAHL